MRITRLLERLLRLVSPDRESYEGIVGDLREESSRRGARGRWPRLRYALGLGTVVLYYFVLRSRDSVSARLGECPGIGGVFATEARHALRRLRRAPGFAAAAAITLALGVGVNTVVFGVVEAVLLRPLPYHEPGQLVHIRAEGRRFPLPFTPGEFESLRVGMRSVEAVGAFRWHTDAVLTTDADSWLLATASVSGNLFGVLDARAALGRPLLPSDGVPEASPVVVISHRLWEDAFGAHPEILGRSFALDDGRYDRGTYQVVGVMPPGFWFPDRAIDLWVPIVVDPTDPSTFDARSENIQVLARMQAGITPESVAGEAAEQLRRRTDVERRVEGVGVSARGFRDVLVGEHELALRVLAGVALVVLLIAVVNLAGLTLAREQRGLSARNVRAALGASRGRLLVARLMDGLLVAALGATAGITLTAFGLPVLVSRLPPEIARAGDIVANGRVLSFGAAMALCGSLLAVLAPIARVGRPTRHDPGGLDRSPGIGRRGSSTLRRSLVIIQIGLSIPLVAGSAVLLHSLWRLTRVSPGIEIEDVWTFRLDARHESMPALDQYFESVLRSLRESEGVLSASIVRDLSFSGASRTNVGIGGGGSQTEDVLVDYQVVHSDFFATLGIPLLAGRDFTSADGANAPRVAIVNQRFVDEHFGGRSPVGRTLALADEPTRIVGVSSDIHRRGLRERPRPELYVPYAQIFNARGTRTLIVRASGGGEASPDALMTRVRRVDSSVAISEARGLAEVLAASLTREKGLADLLSVFAALSLALAVGGLSGLLAFMIAARQSELAVRTALGADPSALLRLVLHETAALCSIGLFLGIPAALALTRVLRSFLFDVSALDPIAFLGVAAALTSTGLIAAWLPARRAMSTDPTLAMKGHGER